MQAKFYEEVDVAMRNSRLDRTDRLGMRVNSRGTAVNDRYKRKILLGNNKMSDYGFNGNVRCPRE